MAEFSVLQKQYFVTEGLNKTISICILLAVGNLGKSVTLTLESEGDAICAVTVMVTY